MSRNTDAVGSWHGLCEGCGKDFTAPKVRRFCSKACRPQGRRKRILTDEQRRRGARNAALVARYGVTVDEWDEVFEAQGRVCAICKNPPPSSGHHLHSDHNHATGEFRGVLCWSCNNILLRRGVTPERLRSAATYLENPPALGIVGPRLGASASSRLRRKFESKFGRSR